MLFLRLLFWDLLNISMLSLNIRLSVIFLILNNYILELWPYTIGNWCNLRNLLDFLLRGFHFTFFYFLNWLSNTMMSLRNLFLFYLLLFDFFFFYKNFLRNIYHFLLLFKSNIQKSLLRILKDYFFLKEFIINITKLLKLLLE